MIKIIHFQFKKSLKIRYKILRKMYLDLKTMNKNLIMKMN